jgi:hypothetical protein
MTQVQLPPLGVVWVPKLRIERISTGADADLHWTVYYTYDPRGNILEKAEFTADQTLARRWRYTYDTQGTLVRKLTTTLLVPS